MHNFNKRGLICDVCGRTFNKHSSDSVCPECFEIAGCDNEVNDHGPEAMTASLAATVGGFAALAVKKGGNLEAIKASCDYIDWTLVPIVASRSKTARTGGDTRATNGVKAPVRVIYTGKDESYRSLFVAFGALGLPQGKMQKFRVQLKLAGRLTFSHEGRDYLFIAAGF